MDIFEQMKSKRSSFSNMDSRIYESIRKFPEMYASSTISELVQNTGFSQAALTRFAKRLGFDGFNLFQYQFRMDLNSSKKPDQPSSPAEIYGAYMEKVEKSIPEKTVDELIQRIRSARSIVLAGSHMSSLPAEYLHMVLNISQSAVSMLYNPNYGIQVANDQDLYILFSVNSGLAQKDILKKWAARQTRPYRVLITVSPKHMMRKYFDEVIVLPESDGNEVEYSVLDDTLAFLLFCDMISHRLKVNA